MSQTNPDSAPANPSLPAGKKIRATNFEISITKFLERLQFNDVEGGRDTFKIGGIQVDACGGHEDNALLVVSCTMKQSLGKKTLRDKINEFRGQQELLEKGFRKDDRYKKYNHFRYILATKNIDVRHVDIEFANAGNRRIYLWDDNFINYYGDLFSKIQHYAKYNLLGEIGVRPIQQNCIQIPCSMTTFGKTQMFLFFVDPRLLLEVSYVARRELPNERYYQRIINEKRLKSIGNYVNRGEILPNNIIIAFGENVKKFVRFHASSASFDFKQQLSQFGVQYGTLEFPKDYRSCWIIDGQHRLYSFIGVNKPYTIPVVAFKDLDIEKQCKIFLDINKFQKPVSADLVWDLNGDMIPSEPDGIISNVIKDLNETETLYHKIYIPAKGLRTSSGLLKMAGLCLGLKRMKLVSPTTHSRTHNPFYDSDPTVIRRRLAKALSVYTTILIDILGDDWKRQDKGFLSTDGAWGVVVRIFEKIVSRLKDKKYPEESDYRKYLSPLKQLFQEKYSSDEALKVLRSSITSESGKDILTNQFVLYIKDKTGDFYFGGTIETPGMKEVRFLEERLKKLIKSRLADDSTDWLKGKIPADVYGSLEKRMQRHNLSNYADLHMYLTFGECMNVLKSYKDVFYRDFKCIDGGFDSEKAIDVAFEHISKVRNTQHGHASGINKSADDDELFRIYLTRVNKCLDQILADDSGNVEDDDSEDEPVS